MKKNLSLAVMALLVLSAMPVVMAVSIGQGIGLDISTEEFPPHIWQCDNRVVYEDCVEEGRGTDCAEGLVERIENYAFEGEQLHWTVLAMDKNKIEEIQDVVATIGASQGTGNDIEVECSRVEGIPKKIPGEYFDVTNGLPKSCEARILEEQLTTFDPDTMAFYDCLFTVETPESMYGEFFVTVEAISADGEATIDENEYWFLNPIIALTIDGDVEFEDVRPGTVSYSSTILVGNDADEGSGVLLDMFISGTDFYDPLDSGAKCPDTNQLQLSNTVRSPSNIGQDGGSASCGGEGSGTCSADGNTLDTNGNLVNSHANLDCQAGAIDGGISGNKNADHLCYYATNGAYSTAGASNADVEGYVPIVYGDVFSRDFYNDAEIIRNPGTDTSGTFDIDGLEYHAGNTLSPGAEIALNFKLGLPEPCTGDFSTGDIFFWGEAI